jgi:hypothetical protein
MYQHIGSVKEGTLVNFSNSPRTFMKVCTEDGLGGVVDLANGELIMVRDLPKFEYGPACVELEEKVYVM